MLGHGERMVTFLLTSDVHDLGLGFVAHHSPAHPKALSPLAYQLLPQRVIVHVLRHSTFAPPTLDPRRLLRVSSQRPGPSPNPSQSHRPCSGLLARASTPSMPCC